MIREQKKLRELLTEREITPYRLAKDCKIGTNHIYNILSGDCKIWPRWRKSIAEYLGLPEEDIFED